MQNLQEIFNRVQMTKRERRNLQILYKDALISSREHKEVTEKIQGYKLRKKQIEDQIKAELGSQFTKYESLKKELELDKELMADIAISTLMKGETVVVQDEDKNPYEPIFSVKFKKTNEVDKKIQ